MIIVTGGSGYIGRHVIRRLDCPTVNIDPVSPPELMPHEIHRLPGTEIPDMPVLIHLAARPVIDAPDLWDVNVGLTRRLSREFSGKIVFASSAAVKDPRSPYGRSKVAAESALANRPDTVIFRPESVAGHGSDVRTRPNPERLFTKAVSGTLTHLRDPDAVRDFIDVEQVAKYLIDAALGPVDQGTYSLGSGRGVRIGDLFPDLPVSGRDEREISTSIGKRPPGYRDVSATTLLDREKAHAYRS